MKRLRPANKTTSLERKKWGQASLHLVLTSHSDCGLAPCRRRRSSRHFTHPCERSEPNRNPVGVTDNSPGHRRGAPVRRSLGAKAGAGALGKRHNQQQISLAPRVRERGEGFRERGSSSRLTQQDET